MGRRLTRKQIKQDEFVTFVDRIVHWLSENWRQAVIGLGAAALIGLIWWAGTAFFGARSASASTALTKAMDVFNAPVGADAKGDPSFATDTERLEAAKKAFQGVADSYWLTPQARMAKLFLAKVAAQQGDDESAIRMVSELARKRDADPVVRLATLDLIDLRMARGEGQQLIPELEAMAAGKDPRLPRDLALYRLAQIQERDGKAAEARDLYKKLTEDYPDSPYRTEAQQKLAAAS